MTEALIPIRSGVSKLSISDDDLCSTCSHCGYQPGETSGCTEGFPGLVDSDGYVQECDSVDEQDDLPVPR